jgi:hypothetical protein
LKKLIATISLGAFIFTSTLVSTGFAADNETAETAKATTTTAENTATETATSAAAMGDGGMIAVGLIAVTAVTLAAIAGNSDNKTPAAHGGHGHGH